MEDSAYLFFRRLTLATSSMQDDAMWDRLSHAFRFLRQYGFKLPVDPRQNGFFLPLTEHAIPEQYWSCLGFHPHPIKRQVYAHNHMALVEESFEPRSVLYVYAFNSTDEEEDMVFFALTGLYKAYAGEIFTPTKNHLDGQRVSPVDVSFKERGSVRQLCEM